MKARNDFLIGETIKRLIYSSMDMCITFIFFSQHLRPVLIKAEKIVIEMAYVAVFTSSSNLYFSLLKFAVLISFSFFFFDAMTRGSATAGKGRELVSDFIFVAFDLFV